MRSISVLYIYIYTYNKVMMGPTDRGPCPVTVDFPEFVLVGYHTCLESPTSQGPTVPPGEPAPWVSSQTSQRLVGTRIKTADRFTQLIFLESF